MLLTGPPHRPDGQAPTAIEESVPAPTQAAAPAKAAAPESKGSPAPAPEAATPDAPAETLRLERPDFIATLTTRGAGIEAWELRNFDTGPRAGSLPIRLIEEHTGQPPTLATPLDELGLGSLAQRTFEIESNDGSTIAMRFESGGVVVRKTFAFEEDGYSFALKLAVENRSGASISPRFGVDWPLHTAQGSDFKEQGLAALHEGSVTRTLLAQFGVPGFFDRSPDLRVDFAREIDWAGMDLPFFLGAVVPDQPALANSSFLVQEPGLTALIQVFFDGVEIPPGQSAERVYTVYIGPKQEARLEALGHGLIRAIDLGYTWIVPLTRFFHWLLQALYSVVPNYGVAIIVLTILVRLVTAPLTNRQMRSMERMRGLAPKLEELRAKFADDKAKQSEAMMKLYRQEGVNPLGGCLPMVLQIPVFIGLFYALRSSIELRHSPFFGWITDLSTPESLFTIPGLDLPVRVLPILMGASMIVQQKLTPMQMDPAQAKMMLIVMPVMMTVMFYQFPSGLVLYWMVSNVIAISHQLWIGRKLRAAA
jgi:YidC/Oxa1 family membrane protein insertase